MTRIPLRIAALSLAAALLAPAPSAASPGARDGPGAAAPAKAGKAPEPLLAGTVVSRTDSGIYTYVELRTGTGDTVWVAGPRFVVKEGDRVEVLGGKVFENLYSERLDRTFERFVGAGALRVNGEEVNFGTHGEGMARAQRLLREERERRASAVRMPAAGEVEPAEGGKTVGQLCEDRRALAGTRVTVRAVVVRVVEGVKGKNWLHLRDGTGSPGRDEVVAATDAAPAPGATVLVEGTLALADDPAAGLHNAVVLEGAVLR